MSTELAKLRHSAAHILAQAMYELYPDTQFAIGPATETGFFYDMQPPESISEHDLPRIEEKMQDIIERDLAITHEDIPKSEAYQLYPDNPFKQELIREIPGETVGLARHGDFYDLCRGGHVESTGKVKHVKLLSVSGSYWRGDPNQPALQRIYGTAFPSAKELRAFEKQREEALKYDHRKLGKELELFSFHGEGVGFPFFHPKGQAVMNTLKSFMRDLLWWHHYQEISTPTMLSSTLWQQSGHYTHYKDNMYFSTIDDNPHAIKPMNCPGSFLIYNARPRSYRELPLRLAEFGHVHRHELSGVLHGLMRVRSFTQDDAHIYCQPDRLEKEIQRIMTLIYNTLHWVGFSDIDVSLATKPESAMGSDAIWDQATHALHSALQQLEQAYTTKEGEGAFYGPKIEIGIRDSLGRAWQCGTVQVDFLQPENFDLTYVASSGAKERPVIIHQAIFGSLERFFAIMLEHHKGRLPFWLAPVQARILPITDAHTSYAQQIYHKMRQAWFRTEIDTSSDPISAKIKSAQNEKIPWMIIVGDEELEQETVTIRYRDKSQEKGVPQNQLIEKAREATPDVTSS